MALGTALIDPAVHDAVAMRGAGADLLSLALMDARSRTLAWLAAFDGLDFGAGFADFDPPWWLAGHAGWYQEFWIARHVQRGRGAAADPGALRLASIEPQADAWFDPQASDRMQRWQGPRPDAELLLRYLGTTLDATLELLERADGDAAALHVFRQALYREDRVGEALAELSQALDLSPERVRPLIEAGWLPELPALARRDALALPGGHITLGALSAAWAPRHEHGRSAEQVPGFEIDAQPVTWAEYVEFIDDGGYDERGWWSSEGWEWLEATARRAPRYVEQLAGGVLARRNGRMQRVPGAQPLVHVSAHEADAWCRWAGRRLPTEAEWELAATTAAALGWRWGQVRVWVAGRARPYAGGPAIDAADEPGCRATAFDGVGMLRVLRGAPMAASARLRHPGERRFALPARDDCFSGFRSCAT